MVGRDQFHAAFVECISSTKVGHSVHTLQTVAVEGVHGVLLFQPVYAAAYLHGLDLVAVTSGELDIGIGPVDERLQRQVLAVCALGRKDQRGVVQDGEVADLGQVRANADH